MQNNFNTQNNNTPRHEYAYRPGVPLPIQELQVHERRTGKERRTGSVLGACIDVLSWADAITRLLSWAHARESRYITICNVHVVVSASRDAAYHSVINASDMAAPDGAPVAWMLRQQGFIGQPRINGPDLMWALCERAAEDYLPVYFYGSTEATLALLKRRLHQAFPALRVRMESPPFRTLTAEEDMAAVERINTSGAGLVFVGLGCPKQERWMNEHRGRIHAVMIGVGAAFDFHAGTVRRAPVWMRNNGLEWLHRLVSEPGRLWKRYLVTNTLFILGAARQLSSRRGRRSASTTTQLSAHQISHAPENTARPASPRTTRRGGRNERRQRQS